jgi:small subunit ribosomal protein S20
VANIKSQIKRIGIAERERLANKAVRSALKTQVKKFETALESGDADAAVTEGRQAARAFDKAAEKNVIHKNKAANHKSAIAKKLNTVAGAAGPAKEAKKPAAKKATKTGAAKKAAAKAVVKKATAARKTTTRKTTSK